MIIFGQTFYCHICKKDIDDNYHRYLCDIAGIDHEFYICEGNCDKKFRGEYVEPYLPEPIENRFKILDL